MLTIQSPREMIEAEIERLIGFLDVMDGEPDLEASELIEDDDPGEDCGRRLRRALPDAGGHEFFAA